METDAEPKKTKHYIIEATADPHDGMWHAVGQRYAVLEYAEKEFDRQNELWGHNTYHRLVEVERTVLRSA